MTVAELIKALTDFSPASEVRIKPFDDPQGAEIREVYGLGLRAVNKGEAVIIEHKRYLT